jgi:hypothetical protein
MLTQSTVIQAILLNYLLILLTAALDARYGPFFEDEAEAEAMAAQAIREAEETAASQVSTSNAREHANIPDRTVSPKQATASEMTQLDKEAWQVPELIASANNGTPKRVTFDATPTGVLKANAGKRNSFVFKFDAGKSNSFDFKFDAQSTSAPPKQVTFDPTPISILRANAESFVFKCNVEPTAAIRSILKSSSSPRRSVAKKVSFDLPPLSGTDRGNEESVSIKRVRSDLSQNQIIKTSKNASRKKVKVNPQDWKIVSEEMAERMNTLSQSLLIRSQGEVHLTSEERGRSRVQSTPRVTGVSGQGDHFPLMGVSDR